MTIPMMKIVEETIRDCRVMINELEVSVTEIDISHADGAQAVGTLEWRGDQVDVTDTVANRSVESIRIDAPTLTYDYEEISIDDIRTVMDSVNTTTTVRFTADEWAITEF